MQRTTTTSTATINTVPNTVDSFGRYVLVTPVLQGNAYMDKYSQSTNMQMQVPRPHTMPCRTIHHFIHMSVQVLS